MDLDGSIFGRKNDNYIKLMINTIYDNPYAEYSIRISDYDIGLKQDVYVDIGNYTHKQTLDIIKALGYVYKGKY